MNRANLAYRAAKANRTAAYVAAEPLLAEHQIESRSEDAVYCTCGAVLRGEETHESVMARHQVRALRGLL